MHSALLPGNQTLHVQPPAQWAPFQTTPPQQCASPLSIWCQARVAPHNLKTFAICGLWKPWKTYSSFILHSNATISIFNLGTPLEMVLRSLHIVVLVPSFRKEERGVGTWLQKRWWSCKKKSNSWTYLNVYKICFRPPQKSTRLCHDLSISWFVNLTGLWGKWPKITITTLIQRPSLQRVATVLRRTCFSAMSKTWSFHGMAGMASQRT